MILLSFHVYNYTYIRHISQDDYLLGKGGYVFGRAVLFVCLSVCLSVDNITQKVMDGLG